MLSKSEFLSSRFLKERFEQKQQKNTKYSLRAFSKKLEITPGSLSKIFSNQKKLSRERTYVISKLLELNVEEKELFLLLNEFDHAKVIDRKTEILEKIDVLTHSKTPYTNLSIEQFKLISNWYGLPIFECLKSYGKSYSIKKISEHFGITITQAQSTIESLKRLEIVYWKAEQWHINVEELMFESNIPNETIRKYYLELSHKSLESYIKLHTRDRVSAAESLTINSDQLEEISKLTEEYITKVKKLASQRQSHNQTYQILLNVFKLNKEKL